jgi:hypothetical protein
MLDALDIDFDEDPIIRPDERNVTNRTTDRHRMAGGYADFAASVFFAMLLNWQL